MGFYKILQASRREDTFRRLATSMLAALYPVGKNNTSGMLIRKVRQCPLEHHDKAIAEADQEEDVEE